MYFDNEFDKREHIVKKSVEIDDGLFTKLQSYTKIYNANISDLINACIENLLKAPNIPLYDIANPLYIVHSIQIKESNLRALGELKQRYGISIFRLINIAIQYTLEQDSNLK